MSTRLHVKVNYTRQIILIGLFFFLFGFITWINGALIPYLKIACQLEEWQAYLVTFAFYIAYTVMALPSGKLLRYTGMIGGMRWGLYGMALGCLLFIPAAWQREYPLFLVGLFIVGTGLTILQTAVNPYITLLGPAKNAAQRMSIMGICNKFAGVLAPIIFGAIILRDASDLIHELEQLASAAREARLDVLARQVIVPYSILAVFLALLASLIRYANLPEIASSTRAISRNVDKVLPSKLYNARVLSGFTAIFCSVGAEVVAGDTIGNYGLYQSMDLDLAKMLTSYTLFSMMMGYVIGSLIIPRFISQEKAFISSNLIALVILFCVLILPGLFSVYSVALLGFANALLWPAIWPQTLRNLKGKQVQQASAILIMGIAGGAIMPLIYGFVATGIGNQWAYITIIPCYLYNIWYWYIGTREKVGVPRDA
ncbi:sugar MFS transporter [Parapedobacter tibetensis]|uniref:sugar MFS transporter n=1 Tax=Parapedobacter tibetensis TaxID=2972951 RepID=UPI00214DD812|nr:sugar MFS transporter [Parapedobacter tibetensis]